MATPTTARPREPVGYSRQAVMVVLAMIALAIFILQGWNSRTDPVFAVRPHPLLPYVFMDNPSDPASDMAYALPWDAPLFTLGKAAVSRFGRSYAAAMTAQYAFLAVFALACAACVWPSRGPGAGALAGILGAIAPVAWVAALGFDDHMMVMSLVALVAACLLNLPGRRTPWLTLPSGVLTGLIARWACVNSNAILALAVIGSLVAGLVFESAFDARRRSPAATDRTRWGFLAGAAVLFLAGAVSAFAFRRGGDSYSFLYYGSQMRESVDVDPARWFASVPAYFTLAWRGQLGPLLPIGVVAAVALWRRKAPGRWSLAAWWLALPLALSLVPKKNAYYGFYAFAAAPVLIASGLSLARSRRAWAALAAGTVVATLGWSVWRMSRVAPDLPRVDGAPVFEQSSDYALRAPETGVYDGSTGAFVADVLSARRASERRLLVVLDARDANERLRYEMLMRDPASELMMLARAGRVPPVGVDPIFAAAPGDGSEWSFAEVVEHVRRDLLVGAGGPVEGYLEELSHRAGEYGVVGRVGEWILFDRAAGATGTAS